MGKIHPASFTQISGQLWEDNVRAPGPLVLQGFVPNDKEMDLPRFRMDTQVLLWVRMVRGALVNS